MLSKQPESLRDDPTLDEVRAYLAPLLASQAAFDGWNEKAVMAAAQQAGVDTDMAGLAFNDGPVDMIDAWFQSVDQAMAARFSKEQLSAMSAITSLKLKQGAHSRRNACSKCSCI